MTEEQVMAIPNEAKNEIINNDLSIELIVAQAEKRVEVLRKVLGIAVKRTSPKDWVDQNGNPYLTASGCEKIAPLFGVKIEGVVVQREDREDEKGKYYIYTAMGRVWWAAGDIEAIGVCSSRDKFFSWNREQKEWKPLSETDEGNIKKAAYTNFFQNAVTRVLGIRNLTWVDLEKFGVKKDEAAKVEYNKGAQSDSNSVGTISEAQNKRLYAIATAKGFTVDTLKKLLKEKFNIDSSKEIKWKQYEEICKEVEKGPSVGKEDDKCTA